MDDLIKVISSFAAGAFSGLLWPYVRDKIKIYTKKKIAMCEFDDLINGLYASIDDFHCGIDSREKWIDRIREFRSRNDDWLGELSYVLERLCWKIEDNDFTHDSDNIKYCCTHLKRDLLLLRLSMLSMNRKYPGINKDDVEKYEIQQLREIIFNESKPVDRLKDLLSNKSFDNKATDLHKKWKNGTLVIDDEFVVSTYYKRNLSKLRK